MRGGLARLGLAAGVAVLIVLGLLLAILPSRGVDRDGSVYSFAPKGLRALFLLEERLGLPVEAWNEAPGHLSGPSTLLVLPRLPEEPPAVPAALAPENAQVAPPPRARDRAHYGRFVAEGGTLLVLGAGGSELEALHGELGLAGLEDLRCVARGSDARAVRLASGETLALAGATACFFGARGAELTPDAKLARDDEGRVLGVVEPSGAGRVALLAFPPELFDNAHLASAPDAALLFTRVLEALAPSSGAFERVLFDEYALGGWRPESLPSLAFRPRLAWLSAHLLLLFLILVWRSAWAGPFPRDPEAVLAASPLARARGFGRVLARAGRWDLLAQLLRDNLLARWDARAGRRAAAGTVLSLEPRLAALAGGDGPRRARLEHLFRTETPRDERELEALDAELRAFEAELFAGRREVPRTEVRPTEAAGA